MYTHVTFGVGGPFAEQSMLRVVPSIAVLLDGGLVINCGCSENKIKVMNYN
jgi:hypothetical protein